MRVSDAFPSQYLKAADLQGRTVKVTIDRYTFEEVGDDRKPILYFVGKEKGLVLNKTNANEIAFTYGDDMDDWGGKVIELFSMMVSYQGKNMPGLRVRVPRVPQQTRAAQPGNGHPASNGHQRPVHPSATDQLTDPFSDRAPPHQGNGGQVADQDLDDSIPF